VRPPPNSYESANYDGYEDEDAEDEDGGRTVVRAEGGPKIVRRPNIQKASPSGNPTSISPAAVIRKTMESQRARGQQGGLIAGPPSELVEDNEDFTQAAPSRRSAGPNSRGITGPNPRAGYSGPHSYEGPPSHPPRSNDSYRQMQDSSDDFRDSSPRSYAPPAHSGPVSTPSSRPGHFSQPPGDPRTVPSQGAYSQPPMAQPSTHQMVQPQQQQQGAMPAHFRMAQTGAVAGINVMNQAPVHHPGMPFDPPGTAVTSNNTRMSGRPAMSWAAALAACGVFIGVVAVAIAQRGDAMSDTQASFVDPAHTGKAAATQQPVANDPAPQPLPPGLIGASPVQPVGQAPTGQGTAVPGMADPNLGLAGPQTTAAPPAGTAPPPPSTVATLPGAKPPKPHWVAPRAPKPAAAAAASDDDDDKPTKPIKTAGGGKKDTADDETKKALEALQKAQLESASSFGK
jgi:hypothetical protein